MVGDVVLMHELGGISGAQDLRLIMTLHTLPLRDMAISLNDAHVTLLTRYASSDVLPVIEVPALDLNIPFGLNVAGGAPSDGARNTLLLSLRTCMVVVADEAIGLVNRQMAPLDELGMARCASKLHPPSQLPQVVSV